MWPTLFPYVCNMGTKSVGTLFPPCMYTGEKECHWTFPAQKKSQQELGIQKVSHEVTHLIIVHVYNWVSATLQYN